MYTKRVTGFKSGQRLGSESGIALLGTTFVLALVMGLLVWGTLVMTRQSAVSAYQVNNANQARTAALIGISALTQYAQNQYAPTAATTSGNTGGSNLFSNFISSFSTPTTPLPTSGNGAVAMNVPIGTNAATSIAFSAPYMAATVSAMVTANTFSIGPTSEGTPGQIIIMSQGASGSARATAVAVLAASSSGASGTAGSGTPIDLNGNTAFSGNVKLIGGENASMAVNGSLSASGSFSGFNSSSSTGSANYSGSTSGMNIFSNESITLTGSGSYNSIQSLGDINISGGVDAVNIQSNGTTTLGSSSQVTNSITSIGNVTLNSGTSAGSVITQGSVSSTNASIGTAQIQGNYSESSNGSAGSGNVGGSISYPNSNNNIHLTSTPGLQVPITALTAQTVSVPPVTANTMSSLANFAFTPPPSSGASSNIQATVVVQNVSGFTNGTYYLYDDSQGHNDYLCSSDTTTPSNFGYSGCTKIANGYSSSNADISYSSGTWTLQGNTGSTSDIVPGVLWFQGNVSIADGTYYDSIIATGNISHSGNSTTYAVNYANAENLNVCSNTGYNGNGLLGTTINPKNFCGSSSTSYNNASVGNIALLSGGDISLGASATVYGDVIAGNVIQTSGSTTIYGYISAASQLNNGEQNSFGGSTTVNIQALPNGYAQQAIPSSWSSTAPQSSASTSIILQSLYWE